MNGENNADKKLICAKCGNDMVIGALMHSGVWAVKGKGLFAETQRSPLSCYVCSECGYCELYAVKPEVFKK